MKKQLLFILLMLTSGYTFAQWSSDPNVNTLVATISGNNNRVSSRANVPDGAGGVITVFEESHYDDVTFNSTYKTSAQRLSATGVKQWGANGIRFTDSNNEMYEVAATADGAGGVVIIWEEETITGDNNSLKIYGQRIGASGDRLWGNNGVTIINTIGEYDLLDNVVRGPDGNFVFAYTDYADNKLYVQKFNSNGEVQWNNPIWLNSDTHSDEPDGGLIYADVTGYYVFWLGEYEEEGEWGEKIICQKLNTDGTKNGLNFMLYDFPPVPDGAIQHHLYGLVLDGGGGFYAAIVEENETQAKLYLQHILSNNTKAFPGWGIEVDASIGKQISGSGYSYVNYGVGLESDGQGGVIIGWTDTRSGNDGLYAQRFNSSGTKLWGGGTDVAIASNLVSSFDESKLKLNNEGDFVFLISKDVGNGNHHLYVQKVSLSGTLLYQSGGIVAASRNSSKYGEIVVSNDKAILVWDEDEYNNVNYTSSYSIYAQAVFSNGLLPVSLINFTASLKTNGALITWQTASEFNNSHFIIERSIDGVDFKTLTTVGGKGTTSVKSSYQFTDISFSQSAYYRLTQVDNNGTKTVYNDLTRYVKSLDAQASIKVYPNPTTDKVYVTTTDIKAGTEVKLINLQGKILASQTASQATLVFEALQLPAGVYFVQYNNGTGLQSQKVVKK